jgi:dipeptide transport system ATP-binding protein
MNDTGAVGATPVLEAQNLSRTYEVSGGWFKPKGLVQALNGVSFTLRAGKTLSIVGESGCGKSTLARQVTMIESPSAGELKLDGVDIVNADAGQIKLARRKVQIVFQNPYASLNPRKKVGTIIQEPLAVNTSLSKSERRDRVQQVMQKVGMRPEQYNRYPHMFSGGQRQRIAIARALMLEPKLVVADEPVSALDVSIQAQVLNLMMDLQEELNLAYLFISHDLSVVEHISDDVMVMYLGRAVEFGPKEVIFAGPKHPYTRALLASTPHIDPAKRKHRITLRGELPSPLDPPKGCAFHARCPHSADECRTTRPELRIFAGREVACHRLEAIEVGGQGE